MIADLEGQLAAPTASLSLTVLLRAAATIRAIRKRSLESPSDVAPFEERLDGLSKRLNDRLSNFRQELVNELLSIEIELRPKQKRQERLRDALSEICRAQETPRLHFDAPAVDGYVLAIERNSVSLPKASSAERDALEAIVRERPDYWMEASILRAERLRDVCDRIAATDPAFEAEVRPMLQYSREFTILLRSKRLKNQPEEAE